MTERIRGILNRPGPAERDMVVNCKLLNSEKGASVYSVGISSGARIPLANENNAE